MSQPNTNPLIDFVGKLFIGLAGVVQSSSFSRLPSQWLFCVFFAGKTPFGAFPRYCLKRKAFLKSHVGLVETLPGNSRRWLYDLVDLLVPHVVPKVQDAL